VLEYAGLGSWLTRRTLALLAVPPLAFALLDFTNEAHYMSWAGVDLSKRPAPGPASRSSGPPQCHRALIR
jgi:hypothetical protein